MVNALENPIDISNIHKQFDLFEFFVIKFYKVTL